MFESQKALKIKKCNKFKRKLNLIKKKLDSLKREGNFSNVRLDKPLYFVQAQIRRELLGGD
jgi:hypothetical protein